MDEESRKELEILLQQVRESNSKGKKVWLDILVGLGILIIGAGGMKLVLQKENPSQAIMRQEGKPELATPTPVVFWQLAQVNLNGKLSVLPCIGGGLIVSGSTEKGGVTSACADLKVNPPQAEATPAPTQAPKPPAK